MPIPIQLVSSFQRSGGMPGIVGQDLPNSVAQLNAQSGKATLAAGTVTISGVTLTANSVVQFALNTVGGTAGTLSAPSASRTTTSFVLQSTSSTDTSSIEWTIWG